MRQRVISLPGFDLLDINADRVTKRLIEAVFLDVGFGTHSA